MQTFLPYPSFEKSAQCLDYRRLGKQRLEAYQIIQAILGKSKGWKNHPATKMWRNNVDSLKKYHNTVCFEWISRGYKNNMPIFILDSSLTVEAPYWLGERDFHASHRSNLLRKDSAFYGQYGWSESDDLPYVWPA